MNALLVILEAGKAPEAEAKAGRGKADPLLSPSSHYQNKRSELVRMGKEKETFFIENL